MAEHKKYLVIGLPQSGKSSFIGPLWHVVESQEIDSTYVINTLPENREYVNTLRDAWFACMPPERNKIETVKEVTLTLEDRESRRRHEITIPDVSGETYKQLFETRKIAESFSKLVSLADGIILFIHPDSAIGPMRIGEVDDMLGEIAPPDETREIAPWEHKHCPDQIVLVDILQMLRTLNRKKIKLAIIISAWDLILSLPAPMNQCDPKNWLKDRLPLLFQYLSGDAEDLSFLAFGLSAQGGQYEGNNSNLKNLVKQSDRIKVQSSTQISHDITLPLKWLFDEQ